MSKDETLRNRYYHFIKLSLNKKEIGLIRRAVQVSECFKVSEWIRLRTIDAAKRELNDYFWHSPELAHIPWDEAIPRLLQTYPPPVAPAPSKSMSVKRRPQDL